MSSTISNYVKEINYLPLLFKLFVQLAFKSTSKANTFINPRPLNISGLGQITKITTLDTYIDYIIVTNKNLPFLQLLRADFSNSLLVLKLLRDLLKLKNEIPADKLLEVFISNF